MMPPDDKSTMRLIRLARIHRGEFQGGSRDAVLRDLEWLAVADDSGLQTLLPLVLRGVSEGGLREHLSEDGRRRLEAGRVQQEATVDRHRRWLARLEAQLIEKDLQIVLLKGAAFSGTVYPDEVPRGAADIDFLVRRDDFHPVCRMLAHDAVRQSEWSKRRVSFSLDYERGFVFGETVPFIVEVHRGLTIPLVFSIDASGLWKNSVPHPHFASGRVRMLSTEDNILHLAVHGYRHLDVMNHTLVDCHELICGGDPDWPLLRRRAQDWKAKGALYLLLKTANDTLETPVPAEVLAALKPGRGAAMTADAVYRYKKKYGLHYGQASYRIAQLLSQLCVPDSLARAIGFQGYYGVLRLLDGADFLARKYRGR